MDRRLFPFGALGIALLAACSGGGAGTYSPQTQSQSFAQAPTLAQSQSFAQSLEDSAISPTTTPFVIHVGFSHAEDQNPKYGEIAFYAPGTGKTAPISVKAGSKVVFLNDDTTRHTASGLGSTGFPKTFDNTSGILAKGTEINGGLVWASGSLNPGQKSKPFTVGPKGVYYFGCYYHYHVTPAMRDVIISN